MLKVKGTILNRTDPFTSFVFQDRQQIFSGLGLCSTVGSNVARAVPSKLLMNV